MRYCLEDETMPAGETSVACILIGEINNNLTAMSLMVQWLAINIRIIILNRMDGVMQTQHSI
jgi:hypothetical protein